jgi:hypothetical protein
MKEFMSRIGTWLFYEFVSIVVSIYTGFGVYYVTSDAIYRLNEWRPGLLQLINCQHEASIIVGSILAVKIYEILCRAVDEELRRLFC